MYEKLEECPVCQHKQFDNFMICTDYSFSGESFALVKCRNCELVFTNPRPGVENLSKYYNSNEYISHTSRGNSLINFVYKIVRNYTLRKKVSLITKINSGHGKVLDYGCGTGDFVKNSRNKGWQAFGYEPDQKAQQIAIQNNPLHIVDSIEGIAEEFDIITAWHVIEHVSTLQKTINTLTKKLRKGGHFIIAVPNHVSYDAQYYKENWAAYDVPRHLYHFSKSSMKELIKKNKLTLISTLPMRFDSYYVSLLSEKYIKGNLFRALRIGYQSNFRARKNNEYSSLIYVVKK